MKYKELDNNQIRFLTDIRQTYQTKWISTQAGREAELFSERLT